MFEILKIVHIYALMTGAVSGIGSLIVSGRMARLDGPPPPVLGEIMATLARLGPWAITVLWVTGLLLVWIEYGTLALGLAFYVKLIAATAAFAVLMYMAKLRAEARRAGGPPDMARMKRLGGSVGALTFVAVVAAVIAFND